MGGCTREAPAGGRVPAPLLSASENESESVTSVLSTAASSGEAASSEKAGGKAIKPIGDANKPKKAAVRIRVKNLRADPGLLSKEVSFDSGNRTVGELYAAVRREFGVGEDYDILLKDTFPTRLICGKEQSLKDAGLVPTANLLLSWS